MWEIDLANQIETFLYSIPLGFLLGVLFYIAEGINCASKCRKFIRSISDVLFFLLAGFITYCFLLARSNGEIRAFVLIGELIGFWLFKKLFSKIFILIIGWILHGIKRGFNAVFSFLSGLVCKMCANLSKIFKKLNIYKKKRLKKQE